MSHSYHEGLPGYDPAQIFHDGCEECEYRGENVLTAIGAMDTQTFVRAWARGRTLVRDGLDSCSNAEHSVLRVLGSIRLRLEDAGILR